MALFLKGNKQEGSDMSATRISSSAGQKKASIKSIFQIVLGSAILYFLLTSLAYAAQSCSDFGHKNGVVDHICGSFSLFDSLDTSIAGMSNGWQVSIGAMVHNTFWILAVIEITWCAAVWALEKDNMSPFISEMIQKIMFIGFYWMILQQAPDLIKAVIDTFAQVGLKATGIAECVGSTSTTGLSPDCIMAKGLMRINLMWNMVGTGFTWTVSHLGEIAACAIASLVILVGYFIMSFQLLMANIEAYILLAAGAVFLGLGSSRWTNDYVGKYFTYTMGVGLRILVMLLVMAAAGDIAFGICGESDGEFGAGSCKFLFEYKYIFHELVVGLLMIGLGAKAPDMASTLMTGQGIGLSAGSMKAAAGSAMGGLQSAVATPVKAASAVGGAAVKGVAAVGKGIGSIANSVRGLGK